MDTTNIWYNMFALNHATIDQEQAKQFSYGITANVVNQYILEHQKEFEEWKEQEKYREGSFKINRKSTLKERIEYLEKLKKEKD